MSGPGLYAISITAAHILDTELKNNLLISYSGGIDDKNIKDVLETGIRPITLSSFLLKPKGYQNIGKLLVDANIPEKINSVRLGALAAAAVDDKNYDRKNVKVYQCRPNYSEFCAVCHNCEDVCPNRANRRININGKDVVLHNPELCNECGACAHNCVMGHKPYLEKACTLEPPSILSNIFSVYFIGGLLGILVLFICLKNVENKKYILIISLIFSSLIPFLPQFIALNSIALLMFYCSIGFFDGFLFIYSIMWIDQFGMQNKKVYLLSIIPLMMGLGIFCAYNFQFYILYVMAGLLCLSCILIFLPDSKHFNTSIVLFKSGSKYYNIETLEGNEYKEYARDSLFRIEDKKEEKDKKASLTGKVFIFGLISYGILITVGICGIANLKMKGDFISFLCIPAAGIIINSLIISSYNSKILPYSIIIFYILAGIFGNILLINPFVEYGFLLCIDILFIQILILLLSKLNKDNKIVGLGCLGICGFCSAACAYCLNDFCGDYIMYLLCVGSIFAIIACYYKIKGIKEIEEKKENNDIELEDIDKE
jgi:ferredoxin